MLKEIIKPEVWERYLKIKRTQIKGFIIDKATELAMKSSLGFDQFQFMPEDLWRMLFYQKRNITILSKAIKRQFKVALSVNSFQHLNSVEDLSMEILNLIII